MKRWLLWFLLAPQGFVLLGQCERWSLPPCDCAVLLCLFLALFAQGGALPGLLLGAAMGRALVDEAMLPVQLLVLGIPVAVLLPLRSLLFGQRWVFQCAAAALCALAVPRLSGLCGQWFDQPSAAAVVDGARVAWTALLAPPVLALLRRLPPLRAFAEVAP
jgi:hypothetical protein